MRPVTAAWEPTIRGSYRMVVSATVCDTFQTGTSPVGTALTILSGSVQLSGTAAVRSTLDLTTDGTDMWPRFAADLLAPYGNEIYVARGVMYTDALVEMVGLGYFRIEGPSQDLPPDGPIRVTGSDRMAGIIEARLVDPVQFMAGTRLGDVFDQLVAEVYPSATIEWDDATDDETLTRAVIADQDRYAFLDDIARAHAKIWYWDHRGILVIKDLPDDDVTVFEVTSGRGGSLVEMSRNLSRTGVANIVVASGEAGDNTAPVRGVAFDDNPDSPTYYLGRFGQVPMFYSSPLMGSTDQAQAAASTILRKQIGLPYAVDFGLVPNPALEPFDAVLVRYSDRASVERHALETLTIPLDEDSAMKATTKEQTTVLIGSS